MKAEWFEYIIYGMAAWRVASLLYREAGPGNVFGKIRAAFGIVHDSDGYPMGYPNTFWGKLWGCMWCLSVWVALGTVGCYIFLPTLSYYFALGLSFSTIIILLDEVL